MTPTRNESFVPLTPASPRPAGERREFRATVISQSGQGQSFQSVAAAAVVTPTVAASVAHAGNCEPKVSLQRDGNRVTGIQIQCSCGQVIDLSCVYDAAPAAAPQPATIPQPASVGPEPGKICNDSGKDLPTSAAKKPKKR